MTEAKNPPRQNKLGSQPIPRLLVNVSLPLMVSMMVQSLYNIVDSMFVARLGEDALTATSIAYPAQMLMLAVAVGTGVGVNALLSRRLGEKNADAVNSTAVHGLLLALLCSLVFIIWGLFFTRPFIGAFSQSDTVRQFGVAYLQICLIGCTGIFLATTGERLLQSTGNTMLSMAAQVLGAITNIILDPLLIFGVGPFPTLGIHGAAIATVVGQYVAAFSSLALNKFKNPDIRFRFRGFRFSPAVIGNIYKIGAPTILVQTTGSLMMIGMNWILGAYAGAVATFGVYYKLWTFLFMPVSGLAQGQLPIVGFNYGAKNPQRCKQAFRLTACTAIAIMVAGGIVFALLPTQLLRLYDASEGMLAIGVPMLRIFALSFPMAAVTITVGFYCSALGNGMVSMISTLLRQLIPLIPLAGGLASLFGLHNAWYASWVSEGIALIFSLICLRQINRRKLAIRCSDPAPENTAEGR